MRWTDSRDGDLGAGSQILVTLLPGQHIITLNATDSSSQAVTAAIEVSATYEARLLLLMRR